MVMGDVHRRYSVVQASWTCVCGAEGLVLWTFVKQVSPSGRAGTGEACRASGALSPLVVKHTKIKANVSLLGRTVPTESVNESVVFSCFVPKMGVFVHAFLDVFQMFSQCGVSVVVLGFRMSAQINERVIM